MERKLREIVRDAQLDPARPLLLAVSGGVDSVVLLDLFSRMAESVPPLRVWHLDHLIRAESADDATFVSDLCLELGVPCRIDRVDVPGEARTRRLSIETAARDIRRELLKSLAQEADCARVVLAHHRDDQAETFLQRMLRGTGKSGLCGMRELVGIWWRPLLDFSRQEILKYAEERGLTWVEDVSNNSPVYLRNRIRHQLLPYLSEYNPRIKLRLTGLSRQFQLEEDFWQSQIELCWPKVLITEKDGLRLDRTTLLEYHPALQARLLREALLRLRGDLLEIESAHLEALQRLLAGTRSQATIDLPGCWAARRYDQLWLRRTEPRSGNFSLELTLDEPLRLPGGRIMRAEIKDRSCGETPSRAEFDAMGLQFPLLLRTLQPGDRFCPSGMRGRRKLKDFMIDLKLEREERYSLPLLLHQDEILWVAGLRRSALRPVTDNCRKILVVQLLGAADLETNPL